MLLRTLLLFPVALAAAAAQPANIRVSSPGTNPSEVTIAVNPLDPRQLIVGANINYSAYSADGGRTWQERALNSPFGVWGDPSIVFAPDGAALLAHLSNPRDGYWLDRLVVQRSVDGGATWNNGAAAIAVQPPTQHDKEWLCADWSATASRGTVYMTWTQFDRYASAAPADSSRVLCARSSDGGQTWSAPVRVCDRLGDCIDRDSTVQGAVPAVGPGGEVYTCWSDARGLWFDASYDGGRSFGADRFLDTQPGGWDIAIAGLERCNGFPVTLCDLSDSRYRGRVYVVWADQRNGAEDTDIFLRTSDDGGRTWSERRRVNGDTGAAQQFFHWATLDAVTGDLWVVYYDRRAAAGLATDVYVARSTDGGATFREQEVSERPFTPRASIFLGDYIGIAAHGGVAWPVWTRLDGTELSLWTAIVRDSATVDAGDAVRANTMRADPILGVRTSLGGARIDLDVAGGQPHGMALEIRDVLGRIVWRTAIEGPAGPRTFWWEGGAGTPSGLYFVTVTGGAHVTGSAQRPARSFVHVR